MTNDYFWTKFLAAALAEVRKRPQTMKMLSDDIEDYSIWLQCDSHGKMQWVYTDYWEHDSFLNV